MITIQNFDGLLKAVQAEVPSITEILLVADESHAVNKIKDKTGIILLAIYPTADRSGGVNQAIDLNITWLFVLEKAVADFTNQQEIDRYNSLQATILAIRKYIEDIAGDVCYMQRLDPSRTQIVPEWRQFGGFNGWSMSLVF